mgnify:CR=1 FL=1
MESRALLAFVQKGQYVLEKTTTGLEATVALTKSEEVRSDKQ